MLTPMPSTCVFTTMSTSSASTPALRSADRRGPSRATSSKARNGSTSTTADGVRTIVADDPMRSERSSVTDQGDSHSRSEEHTSELQSLMRISYAVFCLKKKRPTTHKYKKHTINIINKKNKY